MSDQMKCLRFSVFPENDFEKSSQSRFREKSKTVGAFYVNNCKIRWIKLEKRKYAQIFSFCKNCT